MKRLVAFPHRRGPLPRGEDRSREEGVVRHCRLSKTEATP